MSYSGFLVYEDGLVAEHSGGEDWKSDEWRGRGVECELGRRVELLSKKNG